MKFWRKIPCNVVNNNWNHIIRILHLTASNIMINMAVKHFRIWFLKTLQWPQCNWNFFLQLPQNRCLVFLLSTPKIAPHLSHFFLIIGVFHQFFSKFFIHLVQMSFFITPHLSNLHKVPTKWKSHLGYWGFI